MSAYASIRNAIHAYRERRALIRTEKLIANLPSEIRKDIGWPEPARSRAFQKPRGFVL
ncbi:MAG: hypothetical protein K5872_16080 [Rhizobiaceae bacterium]|nr:hypothetical protein [Rhizobiaceae bacterium]MCV0407741.1 hypothetical protein [Rhizobiaceae bacterium]